MGRDRSVCLSVYPRGRGVGRYRKSIYLSIPGEDGWGEIKSLFIYPRGRGVGRDTRSVCLSIPGEEGWGEIGLSVCLSIPGEEGWGNIESLSVCLSQGKRGGEI